jgi:hypothetical protein
MKIKIGYTVTLSNQPKHAPNSGTITRIYKNGDVLVLFPISKSVRFTGEELKQMKATRGSR